MSDHATSGPRRHRWAAVLVACLLALAGCASEDDGPRPALPSQFDDGVPTATGEIVLTVTTEAGDTVDWDLDTLAMLDQQQLTIVEPFIKEERTYTGPLWADVLRASGVDLDAGNEVELVALDDYVAQIPTDRTTLDRAVLAHLEDGQPLAIEDGGPIRLVYPPDNPASENDNNWIWSIRTARVL